MDERRKPGYLDRSRAQAWRRSLVDGLDPAYKEVVEMMHGGEGGLEAMVSTLRRFAVPSPIIQAAVEYYHQLTQRTA